MEVIIEFIFKIVSRNARVRNWFYINKPSWNFLVNWI